MKAIIFAAGLGTRLRPVTSDRPKALVKIDGITLLEYAIRHLKNYGVKDIIINVHHFAEQVIDFINENNSFGINIQFSIETDELLETGGALKKAEWFLKGNSFFLAYNVDILSNINLANLIKFHVSSNSFSTLAVRNRKTSRYIMFDEGGRMCGWKNMQTNETLLKVYPLTRLKLLAFSGIQVLSSDVFDHMDNYPARFPIMNLYLDSCKEQRIIAYQHDESFWMDIGKIEKMNEADILLSNNNFLKAYF